MVSYATNDAAKPSTTKDIIDTGDEASKYANAGSRSKTSLLTWARNLLA